MARPKKVADAPLTAQHVGGAHHVGAKADVDRNDLVKAANEFRSTLTTVQTLIGAAIGSYDARWSSIFKETFPFGGDPAGLDHALNLLPAPLPAPGLAPPVEEKKERKKRSHDPQAPKRPLTPYFLYMQTARPIIATDLGAEAPKGAIQQEGQRRWAEMSATDKQGWDQAYQYNLRLYNARVHSYKTGKNPAAREMSDDDALNYANEFGIPMPTGKDAQAGNDQDAIEEQLQQRPQEDAAPAKTPKSAKKEAGAAAGGRKRKSEAVLAPAPEPVKPSPAAPAAAAAAASPDKKRKRASKVTEEKEPEPKKSGRKKAKTG